MIRFACSNCGRRINVSESRAGSRGRCPSCKNIVLVPTPRDTPPADGTGSADSPAASGAAFLDQALFDIPSKQEPSDRPAEQAAASDKTHQDAGEPDTDPQTARAQSVVGHKLPWPVDVFLYPANASGLTILGIVVGIPLLFRGLVWLLGIIMLVFPPMFAVFVIVAVIGFIVRLVLYLYLCWYLCECIRHSAQGGRRAPETMAQTPGVGEILLQSFRVLVCLILSWGPVVAWGVRTLWTGAPAVFSRGAPSAAFLPALTTDFVIMGLLLAYAIFFFPMTLLAVVMFDSLSGLNPVLIIRSIYGTFLRYCAVVLVFCALWALVLYLSVFVMLYPALPQLAAMFFVVCIGDYMLMVKAHILGVFYCKNEETLYWDA
jgi:DNA-directed RNA polymerase subunit RPC12/RpoP